LGIETAGPEANALVVAFDTPDHILQSPFASAKSSGDGCDPLIASKAVGQVSQTPERIVQPPGTSVILCAYPLWVQVQLNIVSSPDRVRRLLRHLSARGIPEIFSKLTIIPLKGPVFPDLEHDRHLCVILVTNIQQTIRRLDNVSHDIASAVPEDLIIKA
jgi:hypothetical protein